MSDDVFGEEVPKYWKKNMSVVPVEGKAPLVTGWTGLLGGQPSEAKQAELIEKYGDRGVGLLLGIEFAAGWILLALDVDDDRLWNFVLGLLGVNQTEPRAVFSGKRGKKGGTLFVRAAKSLRSTVIKGTNGLGNVDVLGAGKMTVMPPSIHPDTGTAYETLRMSILEVNFADFPEVSVDWFLQKYRNFEFRADSASSGVVVRSWSG